MSGQQPPDYANAPLVLATQRGNLGDATHLASQTPCGPYANQVTDTWWGTLADLDCVTCRVAARNQILRHHEGRPA